MFLIRIPLCRSRAHQIVAVPDTSFHQSDISRSSNVQGIGRSLQFPNAQPGGIHVIEDRSFSVNIPKQQTFQNLDPLPSFAGLENGITFARDQQGIIRPFRITPLPIPPSQQSQFVNPNILNLLQPRDIGKINPRPLKLPDEFYQTNFHVKTPGPETCVCSQVQKLQSQFGTVFEAVPQHKRRIFRKRKVLTPKTKPKASVCWNRGFKYTCSSF